MTLVALGSDIVNEEGADWISYKFDCVKVGTSSIKFTLTCLKPNGKEHYSPLKVTVDIETLIVDQIVSVTEFLPHPAFDSGTATEARYLKPSEVLKPQRKHLLLESDETPCGGAGGTSECSFGPPPIASRPPPEPVLSQNLVQTGSKVHKPVHEVHTVHSRDTADINIWTCPELRHHARAGRSSNGEACGLEVRLVGTSCSVDRRGAALPMSACCGDSGDPKSPGVDMRGLPAATKSVAILLEDMRGKRGRVENANETIHWLIVDIDHHTTSIEAAASGSAKMPALSMEQRNSFGTRGYYPPCGDDERLFRLHVFAMPHERTYIGHHTSLSMFDALRHEALCVASVDAPYIPR